MWRKLNSLSLPGWFCLGILCAAALLAACSPKQPAGVTNPAPDGVATTVAAAVSQATVGAIATEITAQTRVAAATTSAAATASAESAATSAAVEAASTTAANAAATKSPAADGAIIAAVETPEGLVDNPIATLPGAQNTPSPSPSGAEIPAVLQGLDTQLAWGSSPNKDWFWAYDKGEMVGSLTQMMPLVIRSADGQIEWRVSLNEADFYGNQYIDAYYLPFFWLPSEPYVYLVSGGYGDDQGAVFSRHQNLVRLSLTTGKLEPQVVGPERHYYRFSPSGAYYLEAPQGSPLVRIHHLVDGHVTQVDLHSTWKHSGNALFSTDNRLVVVQSWETVSPCQSALCQRSPLLLIDVETGEYRVISADLLQALGQPQMVFPNFSWLDASHLRITIGSPQMGYSQWSLDLRNNELKE